MPADVFALLADPTRRRLVEVLHDGERSVNDLVAAVRVAQPGVSRHGFDGIIVHCEVLECEPPSRLAYSWSAGPIVNTQVSYRLEPDGDGTRVFFEHSGFDMSQP